MLRRVANAVLAPSGTDEERLRKATLVLCAIIVSLLACIWVGLYAWLGLWIPATIPFAYQMATVLGLSTVVTSRFEAFRFAELLLMLILPFTLQWSLGGFANSSGVALWAFLAPLGALMFSGAPEAVGWFGAFIGLLGASVAADVAGAWHPQAAVPEAIRLAFFGLNFSGVAATAFLLLEYFVRQRDRAHRLLAREQERSERLLLNVLPASIAGRLKRSPGVIADSYDEATVLFADLVDFTPLASALPPAEIVDLLNSIFSEFDALAERYGVEKIKTLGDGYMVAAGVPEPRGDHAQAAAELAIDMRDGLLSGPSARHLGLSIRVGLDTGPVVAGVIGTAKFGYDLWGDTVNSASRMESHAPAGAIQVTERTGVLLQPQFLLSRRDAVQVKGKGLMTTYLLLRRRRSPASPQELGP